MAGESASPTDVPLLRGLFGVLQTGASEGKGTAEIWQDLRTNAGTTLFRAQGVEQPYDQAAVTEAGTAILSAQGVNAVNVSQFRGVAGDWLGSRQALARLNGDEQITAKEIFTPPWAITAADTTPDRYRIRTQWQLDNAAGVQTAQWRTDEVTGPLTSVNDAIGQAAAGQVAAAGAQGRVLTDPGILTDFEIEQI